MHFASPNWRTALTLIGKQQSSNRESSISSDTALIGAASTFISYKKDYDDMLNKRKQISLSDFTFKFNGLSNRDCINIFRFDINDTEKVMNVIKWPATKMATTSNRDAVTSLLVCCIILRKLATPSRWTDWRKILESILHSFARYFGRGWSGS